MATLINSPHARPVCLRKGAGCAASHVPSPKPLQAFHGHHCPLPKCPLNASARDELTRSSMARHPCSGRVPALSLCHPHTRTHTRTHATQPLYHRLSPMLRHATNPSVLLHLGSDHFRTTPPHHVHQHAQPKTTPRPPYDLLHTPGSIGALAISLSYYPTCTGQESC